MNRKIEVLENALINKIAAGEVVERPASVVKELVENSIDAGAGVICVEIKNGGVDYIRVTDNGRGIAPEQARTAFLRHATSKIADFDDLTNVLTLGFRGEALSSVAGVSRTVIFTKTSKNDLGRRLEFEGGAVLSETDEGGADGTDIIVRDLFFNVPARRKFLKRASVESGHVSDIVVRNALGNPHIAFKYVNNGAVMFQTNGGGNLKDVVFAVYGAECAKNMLAVDYTKKGIAVTGLTGKNELVRANRSYENFFINGRYVKSGVVRQAVADAYQTRLPIGKFPVYVLSLTIAPDSCDVNVHPTKLEVRFADENAVYDALFAAVKAALDAEVGVPSSEFRVVDLAKTKRGQPLVVSDPLGALRMPQRAVFVPPPQTNLRTEHYSPQETTVFQEAMRANNGLSLDEFRVVGQAFGTYWIIEQGDSLYYLDQHAAHERVLFEETRKTLNDAGGLQSQKLIAPAAVNLKRHELDAVFENLALLEKLGFEIEELGENAVAVRGVPYIFGADSGVGFFTDIVDALISETVEGNASVAGQKIYDLTETALKINTIACKAAVKANQRLTHTEACALIEQALKLDNPFTCPHGRPTIVEVNKREVEKMFKRT